jgi:hypothetical protein
VHLTQVDPDARALHLIADRSKQLRGGEKQPSLTAAKVDGHLDAVIHRFTDGIVDCV